MLIGLPSRSSALSPGGRASAEMLLRLPRLPSGLQSRSTGSGTMSIEGQQARSELELDLDLTLKEASHTYSASMHILNFAICEGQDHY